MASESGGGGVGFFGLLTILFIGLKLGGIIHWPWLWVLSPTLSMLAVALAFTILYLILAALRP